MSERVPACAVVAFEDRSGRVTHRRFRWPYAILAAERAEEVVPLLAEVERASRRGAWAVGLVTYEAAPAFDRALVVQPPGELPLAWFALFDEAPEADDGVRTGEAGSVGEWTPDLDEASWSRAVREVRDAIARGETYQVNLTLRLRASFTGDPLSLWRGMTAHQRGGFASYLDLGRFAIASASPELFFRRQGDLVEARPMKGTAPRGRFTDEDDARASALSASEKDRAENVMIVDLMRSDLGRIAVPGGVSVPALCAVERYPTVLQMTSTVTARAQPGTSLADLFRALFPSGSVTGAPKASTTARIAALERSPRGAYCGAIGIVEPGGDAVFSVAIRTAVIDRDRGEAEYGVGAGITWGSEAAAEYGEVRLKARVLETPPPRFELFETMRLEKGEIPRLELHLERLAASARYFGWRFDPGAARAEIEQRAAGAGPGGWRLRLRADEAGALRVTLEPLDALPAIPLPVALARTPVDRDDLRLHHKTTRREIYEARLAERPGEFEVLLFNREGELTEFTRGNLVAELDGMRFTPPRECGLLGGVLRGDLLARGAIVERVVRVEDLPRLSRAWLVSSLRGEVPVRIEAG